MFFKRQFFRKRNPTRWGNNLPYDSFLVGEPFFSAGVDCTILRGWPASSPPQRCLFTKSKLTSRGRTDVVSDLADEGFFMSVKNKNKTMSNVACVPFAERHIFKPYKPTVLSLLSANLKLQTERCEMQPYCGLLKHEIEEHKLIFNTWRGLRDGLFH